MTKVIKFVDLSEDEIEMLCGFVPLIRTDETTVLVPVDCEIDLKEDGEWINGLTGTIVNL